MVFHFPTAPTMKPVETNPGRDDGAERDTREPKPCCNRLPEGGRCLGPAGHADDAHCMNKTDSPTASISTVSPVIVGVPVLAMAGQEEDLRVRANREAIWKGYSTGRQLKPGG